MKRRVGIFGGTFNPPHIGHVSAAKAFSEQAKLDELIIMPAFIPPHKAYDSVVSCDQRLEMCKIAFSGINNAIVSDHEIARGGTSYTYITLQELSSDDTELYFLCGTDMFLTLDRWFMSEEIFRLCRVALMQRENDKSEIKAQIDKKLTIYRNKYNADVIIINEPPIEISSSDIRGFSDEMRKKYLPKPVYDFVKERGLYADK